MQNTWNELFGERYYIEIKNDERKYFGLDEIREDWDISRLYRKSGDWYQRTTIFWDGDIIQKVINEENVWLGKDEIDTCHYKEFDTKLATEQREYILPFTARGKKKKLTPSNLFNIMPFGTIFQFDQEYRLGKPDVHIWVYNQRNNQKLAIGEEERISQIRTGTDFRDFVEYYIATCPDYYMERVHRLKTEKHKTVKYQVGDVFRIEVDRFRYVYGIITTEVKKMVKCLELPPKHTLRSKMMVPLMVRFYDLVTTDGELTAEDLKHIPLGEANCCGDNDIIWGRHPIVGHKTLGVEDLDFNLICKVEYNYLETHRFQKFDLYVEWGTAAVTLQYHQLSDKLKGYMEKYSTPFDGVTISIWPMILLASDKEKEKMIKCKYDLRKKHNQEIKEELFLCLGLDTKADFDDFAEKYGGLKRAEILKKICD